MKKFYYTKQESAPRRNGSGHYVSGSVFSVKEGQLKKVADYRYNSAATAGHKQEIAKALKTAGAVGKTAKVNSTWEKGTFSISEMPNK